VKLSFEDLSLDKLGRVILSDEALLALDESGLVWAGGTDGQTNSGQCTNTSSCANSTNGQCTNSAGACEKSRNTQCGGKPEDEMEIVG
jgi:hypothetical protein